MILTGSEIQNEVASGAILIRPFNPEQLNPNSYNYRLSDHLYRIIASADQCDISYAAEELELTEGRWLLVAGELYLAATQEQIGSNYYVTSLIGRSSLGRVGLFVQVSANIGHQGSFHCWTLELRPSVGIYLYPFQLMGQVSFWMSTGEKKVYTGTYGTSDEPRMGTANKKRRCDDSDRSRD